MRILAKYLGLCILEVVLIHSLGGFEYSTGYNVEFVILRQIINYAVATFVFMAGYFVNVYALSDKELHFKHWLIYRERLWIPFMIKTIAPPTELVVLTYNLTSKIVKWNYQ